MSTELNEGTQALTTVADVADDMHIIARNSEEMRAAQGRLAAWFRAKETMCRQDHAEAEEELAIAERNGWKLSTFKAQTRRLLKRALFYEKCALATEAGYAVIPNIEATCFAIRTSKKRPNKQVQRRSANDSLRSEAPPAGDGEWKDDRAFTRHRTVKDKNYKGEIVDVKEFWNTNFDDEIDFPVSIAKPALMTATEQAMATKFFDELHVVENFGSGGDPMLLGIIRRNDRGYWPGESRNRLTFLIGWYINTREL